MTTLRSVLLINSNPDAFGLIVHQVCDEFNGLRVQQITSPDRLAEALNNGGFDLVIADDRLDWGDTAEVVLRIRERWPDCPVIVLSETGGGQDDLAVSISGTEAGVASQGANDHPLSQTVRIALQRALERKELRETEARLRSLFEGVPVGLYRSEPGGRILDANATMVRMLGYRSRDELLAVDMTQLYLDPEDRRRWRQMMEEQGVVHHFEVQLRRRDGSVIWVDDSARSVEDADGRLIYFEGCLQDISARKLAEEEREKLQAQLLQAQKMEAIGTLVGGIAHDFNNLLTGITGYVELALAELEESHPVYPMLNSARRASTRAADLTRQLLLFSRRQRMEKGPMNLNDTVETMADMAGRLIGENIIISAQLVADIWTVEGDAGQIEQVLMNLIVNARDAMPAGGELVVKTENVEVDESYCQSVRYARPGKYVLVSVTDNGVGMDSQTVERIFEPFFTTKGTGQGTGLGLSVVYGIVKNHGGWVNVRSQPGQGSTFQIYLPAASARGKPAAEEHDGESELRSCGERILVVEDEQLVRELNARMLREHGYVPFAASCVEEALAIFEREQGRFSLVLSDVVLPDRTGLELVDELRSRSPDLRVILTSGYSELESQWTEIRRKGWRFLQKPYRRNDFLLAVREVLDPKHSHGGPAS